MSDDGMKEYEFKVVARNYDRKITESMMADCFQDCVDKSFLLTIDEFESWDVEVILPSFYYIKYVRNAGESHWYHMPVKSKG